MTTLLESPIHEVEMIDFHRDDSEVAWKTKRNLPDQDRPMPLWLKARARTIGFRRHELEGTHWRKVWRSMVED